jgi:DHA1 family bicyclomycin/chloramphenicol resistance-like MFS transporter
VQLTLSAFVLGFAVMQLFYGPLSDRFGRRPLILGGNALFLAASLYCVFAPSIEALIAGRFFQAMGACCGPVLGRAAVRDLFARDQAAKVMSYMASGMALGPLIAPTIGGWLHSWFGWRTNFAFLGLFAVLLIAAVWRSLPETNRHKDAEALDLSRLLGTYRTLLGHRLFLGYSFCAMTAFCGLFAYISSCSFILIDIMGLDPRHFGLAFSTTALGFMLGSFMGARLTHRLGIERMVGLGSAACLMAGLAGIAVVWSGAAKPGTIVGVAVLMAPMLLYFAACAWVMPNASAGAIAPFPRAAGAASSVMGFFQMGGGAVAGWAAGHLYDGSARPLVLLMSAMGLASLVVWFTVVRPAARR